MSTKAYYPINETGAGKVGFSTTRSIYAGIWLAPGQMDVFRFE